MANQVSKHLACLPSPGEYAAAWKRVKANPDAYFHCYGPLWPGGTGKELLRRFRQALNNRINLRGGIIVPDYGPKQERRTWNRLQRVRVECRWCGQPMAYKQHSQRFCSPSCHRSFLT